MATSVAAGAGEANGFGAGVEVTGCAAGEITGAADGMIGSGGGVEVCGVDGLTNASEVWVVGALIPGGDIEGIGGWPIDGDGSGAEAGTAEGMDWVAGAGASFSMLWQ